MSRLLATMVSVSVAAVASRPASADSWRSICADKPVFAESFAGADISARWTTIVHPPIANGNGELQAYQQSAVTTGASGLHLTATRHGAGYVSGRIASIASFRYGCFDIVAQLPAGRGLWPALWLRTPYGRPIDGEIDIVEGFGSHPGIVQSTLHRWAAGVHHGFVCTRVGDIRSSAFGLGSVCGWRPQLWPADFVTTPRHYQLIWTPQTLTWLIDGKPFFTLHGAIPSQPMAVQLNLAVGGVFDGNPDGGTVFPAVMTVRSVNAWQMR